MVTSNQGTTLLDAVRQWPTPCARSSAGASETQTREGAPDLQTLTREWATPAAGLFNYSESPESFAARSARLVAEGTRPLGANLGQQAQGWQTPRASDGAKGGPAQALKGKPALTAQARAHPAARAWPSPAVRDFKGPVVTATERADGTDRTRDQLPNAVAFWDGPGTRRRRWLGRLARPRRPRSGSIPNLWRR